MKGLALVGMIFMLACAGFHLLCAVVLPSYIHHCTAYLATTEVWHFSMFVLVVWAMIRTYKRDTHGSTGTICIAAVVAGATGITIYTLYYWHVSGIGYMCIGHPVT